LLEFPRAGRFVPQVDPVQGSGMIKPGLFCEIYEMFHAWKCMMGYMMRGRLAYSLVRFLLGIVPCYWREVFWGILG
jgi:hypothetical protein